MSRSARFTCALASAALLAGSAHAAVVPLGFGSGTPVNDGSFELGPPPASAWTEESTTSECGTAIGDWSETFGITTPDGVYSFWAGGLCTGGTNLSRENRVIQEISVPSEDPYLIFWYLAYRSSTDQAPGSDVGYVEVEGTEVWTYDISTKAATTDGDDPEICFLPARVDLTAHAGQTVELVVGIDIDAEDLLRGNVLFDDFRFADLIFADNFTCGTFYWSDALK
jgi:hypothetical protein